MEQRRRGEGTMGSTLPYTSGGGEPGETKRQGAEGQKPTARGGGGRDKRGPWETLAGDPA